MLTLWRSFTLWLPLALMWALMSTEGPIVQAVAARAADPELNLAAYGFAFFSILLIEAPVFMFLSASNALVKGPLSYPRFRNYAYFVSFLLTLLSLAIALSGSFYWFGQEVAGLSEELSRLSEDCLTAMSIAPLMVGYRRFHQGILVKAKQSVWIAIGAVMRLILGAIIALLLFLYSELPGGLIACITLSVAIVLEAYFIRWRSSFVIAKLHDEPLDGDKELTLKEMNRFYVPLAVSSIVNIGVQPVLTFFLAQSYDSVQALAVWPVLMSFTFLFMGPTIAYQDIVIAHKLEHDGNGGVLARFGFLAGAFMALLGGLFVFSPLYQFWFLEFVGLTKELASYMFFSATFCIPLCFLGAWVSWLRAVHTLEHTTRQIFIGSAIELSTTFLIMWWLITGESAPGALAGILSFSLARTLGCTYMWRVRYSMRTKTL